MAKRFTDTEIWNQDWFLDIPKDYKLFYFYMKDSCNHAGIFKPNFRVFSALNECSINGDEALDLFNSDKERILVLENGRWFIIDFFKFQYGGKLNTKNNAHKSALKSLEDNGVILKQIKGVDLSETKEIDANPVLKTSKEPKVKKDTTEREAKFKEFYDLYDKKKAPDLTKKRFLALTDKEVEAIFETVKDYVASTPTKKFRKDPASYLNNKSWKDEIITEETNLINESITVEKVVALFNETDFPHTIKQYKTDKPSLKIRLNEFLEKNCNTTDFKRKTPDGALKWFVSSLEYSRPKIVIKQDKATWILPQNKI